MVLAARPAPSSRIFQSAAASLASLDDPTLFRVRGGECRCGPSGDLGLVGSAEFDQQPALAGRKLRHRGGALAEPNNVTIRASRPSTATGRNGRIAGTASAAEAMSG